ncbi:MAG: hypothetical protein HY553_13545 [Elusimicrobia bacterium]|nr:hypothetical protein [Elusimicrobiota bacterium]
MLPALIAAVLLAASSGAEEPFFDASSLGEAVGGMQETGRRIEARNALPRIPPGSPEAHALYNSVFPHYAELCAVTRYDKKGAEPGGAGGHAIMFMNGAEIDASAGYPRLRLVPEGTDLSGADSGVGISVNKIFANVNWVAIPGRSLFFHGGLSPADTLDQASYDAVVMRAAAQSWFDGIRAHDEILRDKPAAMPLKEFMVRRAIGTDFALTFARTAHCSRLPLSREQLGKVLAHLNTYNENAQKNGYQWNGLTNNCSHVPHNALATLGIWDAKQILGNGPLSKARAVIGSGLRLAVGKTAHMSFPANSFVRLYEAGNTRPIDDPQSAFADRDVARTMKDGWTSTGPGALIVHYPIHSKNALFDPGGEPLLASIPAFWEKKDVYQRLVKDPPAELTDLGANLESWNRRYQAITTNRRDLREGLRLAETGKEREAYRDFYSRFYADAEEQQRLAETRLAEYRRATSTR